MFKKSLACLSLSLAVGCGSAEPTPTLSLIPVGQPDLEGLVVKARSTFEVSVGARQFSLLDLFLSSAFAASGTQIVTTTLSSSTTFSLNNSLFSVPSNPTPFAVNDLGFLQIGSLQDNDLKVCGTGGGTKCGTALIRIYTTGTAGAGLWNSADGYGAPITAGQTTLATVGLNAAGAAIMQQVSIPTSKHVLNLSDFANPKYDTKVDFTDAGAGAYSTTIVVEYALAL
jgi:hypothetical protein